jgi:two-component system OmpR family response regulator
MRVLLLEDDEELGAAIQKSLAIAGYAVDWMRDAKTALHAIGVEHFDLLLLDLGLPDRDGTSVLADLRQRDWRNPIMVITARDAVQSRVHALDLGADDYMVKPVALDELCARVRALIRRQCGATANTFTLGQLEIDLQGKVAMLNKRRIEFSRREWSVLEYLALKTGKVISKEQLIEAISNWDKEISPNAIEAYVHRVRAKLHDSGVEIRTIRGLGYMLSEDNAFSQ